MLNDIRCFFLGHVWFFTDRIEPNVCVRCNKNVGDFNINVRGTDIDTEGEL